MSVMGEHSEIVETEFIEDETGREFVEAEAGGDGLLGKVLRPKGTRDFPANTKITIRNNSGAKGRYSYRNLGGQVKNYTIMPNQVVNHTALVGAVVKNIGDVDLDVTP